MWSNGGVVLTPVRDDGACILQIAEPVLIPAFVANLLVAALDEAILQWLA